MNRSSALPMGLFALLSCVLPTAAQEAAPQSPPNKKTPSQAEDQASIGAVLPEVVVVANRQERAGADVPASVTVLNQDASVFSLATSMRDYQRYEPGVSLPYGVGGLGAGRNSRAGNSSINIRGMDGNRVLMTVDGIRQADVFTFGGSYNVGRDYVDVDSLKQVEILKNAASSLYGSDALGGVVSFTTIDPSDLLDLTGKDFAIRLVNRYDTADDSWGHTLTTAQRAGNVEMLFHYTRRDGSELDNRGTIQPDPSNYNVNNWLTKLVWNPSTRHRFELAAEYLERSSDNDLVSARRMPTGTSIVRSLLLNDDITRMRFSLEHKFDASGLGWFFDQVNWNLYYQNSQTAELLLEDRDVTAPPTDQFRLRHQFYRQDHIGANLNFTKEIDTGSLHHALAWGTEIVTSFSRRVRDGTLYNITAGTQTKNITPDVFPLKDMPDTRTTRVGVYLQDEISWGADRRFRLTPGLRFEYYNVAAEMDRLYGNASGNRLPQDFEQFAIAPKLAFLVKLDEEHTAYFQYANGFRNPTSEELNASLTNVPFNYQTIPNPDLKMETSHSFELGLRRQSNHASWNLATFYNYYTDFIETFRQVGGTGAPGNPLLYQSTNLSSAEIWGVEFKGETDMAFISEAIGNFSVFGNAAYLQGYDGQYKQPLASVDPFKLVTGLRYRQENWQVELISTFFARQNRTQSVQGGIRQFETPSAFTLDLVGRWQVTKNVSVNAGLYNLTNEQYWRYQDVRGIDTTRADIDRFTQPGISGRVAVTVLF
ncbi:MAG: TonB-dependent hemoglobin/transferrin/lactoferrin family receptor [Prosthecobacter sp.]